MTRAGDLPNEALSPAEFRRRQHFERLAYEERRVKDYKPPLPWDLRIIFIVITLAVLAQVGWIVSGGTIYRVTTESMCPEVCVGALVIDRPLAPNTEIKVGETVSFVPPGFSVIYTHRVVKVYANGTFETKGDAANVIDPWVVSPSDVKGVTVATIWGMGFLSAALPILAAGMALILILRRQIEKRVRRDYDRMFAILLIIVPIWIVKPLIRGVTVATSTLKNHLERVVIVNTGLLPAQFRAKGGQFKDFVSPGQRITLTGPVQANGQVGISQFVSFHWYGWAIVGVVVASPLVAFVLEIGYSRRHLRRASDGVRQRRTGDTSRSPVPVGAAPYFFAPSSPDGRQLQLRDPLYEDDVTQSSKPSPDARVKESKKKKKKKKTSKKKSKKKTGTPTSAKRLEGRKPSSYE